MPSPNDLAALDAAWDAWVDRSSPPPALSTLLDRLRDEAGREVCAASFGAARAEAIAAQLYLTVAAQRLHGRRFGFAGWQTLAGLSLAAEGDARAELLGLTIEAGGGAGEIEPECLAMIQPLLAKATVRAWAITRLSAEGIDARDQGLLLGLLPEEDVAALLPPRIEQAAALEDADARWTALVCLVARVPERWKRLAAEASRARHGVDLQEAYRLSDVDEVAEQRRIDAERARWGAPFTAWRLGEQARRLPEGERGPILDRAIDEFEAIALTPISPGNDEGPFWAIAGMFDEARVRRALAVVDRMEGADWKGDLGASRASLIARLSLLGHPDEAERMIQRIGAVESLATHWRAVAWGGVIGARMALCAAERFEARLRGAADDPSHDDPEWRFRVLLATIDVFDDRPPPDAANVEALIALATSFEPGLRQTSLEHLVGRMLRSLPMEMERWIDVILAACEGQGRVEALLSLSAAARDAGLDPVAALRPLLAQLGEQPCAEPLETFRDLCDLRAWIAPDDVIGLWSDYARRSTDPGVGYAVDGVEAELAGILAWLAGPLAPLAAGRALARATARFV